MRVLFVTYRFPAHEHDAACHTVYRLVRHFAARHEVSLAGLAPSSAWANARALVAPYCRRIETHVLSRPRSALQALGGLVLGGEPLQVSYFRSSAFAALVRRIVEEEEIDVAYGYHLRSAQYIADLPIPRLIALQPAQILHFGRRGQIIRDPVKRLAYSVETRRLRGYERRVGADFDRCLLISQTDWNAIDPDQTLDNVVISPHGVDTDHFIPPPGTEREPRTIVFSGALGMDTNSDAVLYFCREVLPLVHREAPDARVFVVGKDPPASVRALTTDRRITVTGFVSDLRPWLWRAQIAVDPLRIGAGLQNKILEAMAARTPVVATSVANEGIGADPGHEILLADDPPTFARRVVDLMGDDGLRERIATAGRALVERRWSWTAWFDPLEELMTTLGANGRGR